MTSYRAIASWLLYSSSGTASHCLLATVQQQRHSSTASSYVYVLIAVIVGPRNCAIALKLVPLVQSVDVQQKEAAAVHQQIAQLEQYIVVNISTKSPSRSIDIQSRFGDKASLIPSHLSPKRDCGSEINTCTKLQLLLGEGSSAFLIGKFEPSSRYLTMGDTWRSATPSSCSPTPTLPTLPRAASAVLKPCLTGVCFF